MTPPVELLGAPYSVYVRICRIVLAEKGVDYVLHPVDVFADGGPPDEHLSINPFGRIPAMRHGEFSLYETDAITSYINEAFDGRALMPPDLFCRARARQIMRLADNEIYRHLVWGVYVPWQEGMPLKGLVRADLILGELQGLASDQFMAGPEFSLADAYVYPMLKYFSMVPEGSARLDGHPALDNWMQRMEQRESVRISPFPGEQASVASL